jgi:hypothetical protein
VSRFLRHDRKADPEGHNMSGKRAKLGLLRLEFSPRPIRYWMISKKIVVLDHKAREGQPRTAAKKQSDCDALSQVPRTIYELCLVVDGSDGCDKVWLLQTGHIHLQSR